MKTPAAVSLACLAATLLIAAQGFKGHPGHGKPGSTAISTAVKSSDAVSQHPAATQSHIAMSTVSGVFLAVQGSCRAAARVSFGGIMH